MLSEKSNDCAKLSDPNPTNHSPMSRYRWIGLSSMGYYNNRQATPFSLCNALNWKLPITRDNADWRNNGGVSANIIAHQKTHQRPMLLLL
jgi:hypothetical protein